uniref:Odorant receptor n=1 Tax=Glyphodes pyloalis TaxID=1242752 RepID=A0A6M3GVI9_GLYPY|nr:olfactory receptor [Glyphodes pyloalis]
MVLGSKKEQSNEDIPEYHFKPFHERYRWITFTLTLGLMYPNPATERTRIIVILTLLALSQPIMFMILIDMYVCWAQRDMFNIIRHSTIVGPFLGAFFKMFVMFYKRVQAKELIDEMNRDYASYNTLPRRHQATAARSIQNSVFYTECLWSPLICIGIMMFPAVAVLSTLYSHIFDQIPRRYMIHDLKPPFREPEARFDSPYFEIQFIYMLWSAVLCWFNYTSYDGLFGLVTNHACLKMSMNCLQLQDAFAAEDPDDVYSQVMEFMNEQKRMFRFGELIQDTFNIWLGTILISTMIQIGSLLFHISAGYGFDLRYTLFSFCSVVHIFLPCKNASNLTSMSTETSTMIYCAGWEKTTSHRVLRLIPFMLARAQRPLQIQAFYMFQYNKELFINIMRTSYSMFTLLRS